MLASGVRSGAIDRIATVVEDELLRGELIELCGVTMVSDLAQSAC